MIFACVIRCCGFLQGLLWLPKFLQHQVLNDNHVINRFQTQYAKQQFPKFLQQPMKMEVRLHATMKMVIGHLLCNMF